MPSTRTFLSYARADGSLVTTLERILRERGIRTWRDIHDSPPGPTLETLEEAISSSDGFLIVVTSDAASSPTIRNKELPIAAQCAQTKPGFFLLPAFVLSPHEASEAFRGCLDVPISAFSGVVIHPDDQTDSFRTLARVAFNRLFPRLPGSRPPSSDQSLSSTL